MIQSQMIISNNSSMNILLPNNNTLLKEALKNIDNKELLNLLQNKNLSTQEILKNIFEQLKNPDKSNQSLLNFLKNSNFFNDLGNLSSNINDLLKNIKSDENLKSFSNSLENFSKNIKDIDAQSLEKNIRDSGIFLESKLNNYTNIDSKNILNDLKTIILKLQDEIAKNSLETKHGSDLSKLVDKILTQIETSQMYSILSNSNYIYIPFLWQNLEEGNIEITKNESDNFYCKINITLKNYGKVELTLGIFEEKDFEIYANFENKEFKEIFKEKLTSLKDGFKNQEINIKVLRINDFNENKSPYNSNQNIYDVDSSILNQLDIKA